ncbi:Hypothetical predicted protein, partial [Paramuricea clavata]
VNQVQELSLKVKHFLPPVVSSPEIFVLFGNHDSLSHTLDFSVNTASDLQDYGSTVRGYLMYTRETDGNSKCSSPERVKTEHFDTDAVQRRVHFEQNGDSSKENNVDHGSKRTVHEDTVRKNEETYLTELPQATESNSPEEKQQTQRLSNSRQDNQKSHKEDRRPISELPKDQNLQGNQVCSDDVNGVTSRVPSSDNRSESHDTKQMSSNFEDQHSKSPRNKIHRKNPLLHSKTAPSLLQTSWNETIDRKSEENGQNERSNQIRRGNDEHAGSLNNKEGNENVISNEYPDHVQLGSKNESEVTEKASEDHEHRGIEHHGMEHHGMERHGMERHGMEHDGMERHGMEHHGMEHDGMERHGMEHHGMEHHGMEHHGMERHGMEHHGMEDNGNKNNFQIEKKLAGENGDACNQTQVADSTQENIKHSADHSVASSGFESLNQSNNDRHDIERTGRNFGVTIAEKENLVLQLQAELNAVRSERSNSEKTREQLLKKAKNLQNQNNQKRNQAKTVWKKRYFEEKKKTVSLEERCNQLRYEVEIIHKKILSSGDAKDRDSASACLHKDGDPKKLNAKIMLTRKENEVDELRRRVEEAKIKLGSEMKLRDNAQKELKHIRDEVIDKKINATLVKKSLSLLETRSPNDV